MWPSVTDFVETGRDKPLLPGDSIGREKRSADTNTLADWAISGSAVSWVPTPQRRNVYFALLNEILLRPDPGSSDVKERRAFIEIHFQGEVNLKGCALVNDLGTFLLEFDEDNYDFHEGYYHVYFTIQHNADRRLDLLVGRQCFIPLLRPSLPQRPPLCLLLVRQTLHTGRVRAA